jgi:outer membrane protein TolC
MRTHRRVTVPCGLALALAAARPAFAAPAGEDASADAELAGEARLETILRVARARNPERLELDARARAARAHADVAAGLEDVQLKAELWGVPLEHPVSFGRAQTIMVGARRAFPAPGTRDLRARVALEEAGALGEAGRARELELTWQVRQAYADYWRAEEETRIHLDHVRLLSQMVDLARSQYRSGDGSQQDLLRLTVELGQLHADVTMLEQERRSSRGRLNVLMGRTPDAPLGSPPATALAAEESRATPSAAAARPEVVAAERAVRRGEAALELARRASSWPSFMVGADYWYMPLASEVHGYGAMVAVDLPWLNPRHASEVREAELTLDADRRALDARRNAAAYEALDASARADAARAGLRIVDEDLLPQARRSYESAEAAYRAGHGAALALLDAARAYLQARLDRSRALARLATSQADLDRAAGLPQPPAGAQP